MCVRGLFGLTGSLFHNKLANEDDEVDVMFVRPR